MPSSSWKLLLTRTGPPDTTPEVVADVVVEAESWLAALREARRRLGEDGAVPAGASCVMAASGEVTIVDAARRRRFVLTRLAAPASNEQTRPAQAALSAPAVLPGRANQTLPYSPERAAALRREFDDAHSRLPVTLPRTSPPRSPPAPPPDLQHVAAADVRIANENGASSATDVHTHPSTSATVEGAAEASADDAPPNRVVTISSSAGRAELRLLAARDVEPNAQGLLTYRERAYLLTDGSERTLLEQLLRAELASIQASLARHPRGQYVALAIFDAPFEGAPDRPPIATLEWKDWRGSPVFALIGESEPATVLGAASSTPLRPSSQPPANRRPRTQQDSSGVDNRLAAAFEAMPDLYFLATPIAALEFTLDLVARLVPSEAVSACLYDLDTDEFRFVALAGPGAATRQASAIPAASGLFGAAIRQPREVLVVPRVQDEPRFDPAVDGRDDLEAHSLAYLPLRKSDQLFGMLQLTNRAAPEGFTDADVSVLSYVAAQLTDFLASRRGMSA